MAQSFSRQLFIKPQQDELENHQSEFTVISAPNFKADPSVDGTNSETFIIISFKRELFLLVERSMPERLRNLYSLL